MHATPEPDRAPALQFILKVASRCNLSCSYCYVYNKGDESWRDRPSFMSDEIAAAALRRIREHCGRSAQGAVRITFHGGEPCLAGPARFAAWCDAARTALGDACELYLSMQTNGTLLDDEWIRVLRTQQVSVGLSLDGPAEVHDRFRVDHAGRGSHRAARHGLELLRDGGVPFQVLSVIQLGASGLAVHRHLLGLGATRIHYLLPDFTHDTIEPVRRLFGATPCADFLLPILDEWWASGSREVRIGLFWNMARVILGGDSELDMLGNQPYRYVFVETGGDIEGLDVLRVCGPSFATTGLNVLRDDFVAIYDRSEVQRKLIFEGPTLPSPCRACPEAETCGGGYLPHRYAAPRGFDNATVWCADMLLLMGRMRRLLDVDREETRQRRTVLEELHRDA